MWPVTTAATPGKNPNATNDSRIPEIPVIIEAIDNPCGGPAGTGVNDASPGIDVPSYPAIGVPFGAVNGSCATTGATGGTAAGDAAREAAGVLATEAVLATGFLAAGFFAAGVALALGALAVEGVGIGGVTSSELLLAMRSL
jgi:hypothetical protein